MSNPYEQPQDAQNYAPYSPTPQEPPVPEGGYPGQPVGGPTAYPQPNPYVGQAYPGQQYQGQDPYAGQAYQQPYPGQAYQGQPYPGQAPYGYPGAPVANYDPLAKSQLAAGLLGIFLGSLGVHRFYLGYIGIGILQIFVTIITLGIGGLWGFIEGIMILAGAQYFRVDATGRPLKQ